MRRTDQSGGSANLRQIGGDLNSAVLQEVVGQLNAAEIPVIKMFRIVGSDWRHFCLGSWRYDAYVKNLRFFNVNNNDFAGAQVGGHVTGIEVRHVPPALLNMNQNVAPAGEIIFQVGDFTTAPFPAKTALWAEEFKAGINCDAVIYTGNGLIPAGNFLVASFRSADGMPGNGAFLAVLATITPVDRLGMAIHGLERSQQAIQNFNVKSRGRE